MLWLMIVIRGKYLLATIARAVVKKKYFMAVVSAVPVMQYMCGNKQLEGGTALFYIYLPIGGFCWYYELSIFYVVTSLFQLEASRT